MLGWQERERERAGLPWAAVGPQHPGREGGGAGSALVVPLTVTLTLLFCWSARLGLCCATLSPPLAWLPGARRAHGHARSTVTPGCKGEVDQQMTLTPGGGRRGQRRGQWGGCVCLAKWAVAALCMESVSGSGNWLGRWVKDPLWPHPFPLAVPPSGET